MANVKYDFSRVPRELLEKYAANFIVTEANQKHDSSLAPKILKAAYVPLRTKAEVDADIVRAVRDYCKDSQCPVSQLGFYSEIDEERGRFSHFIEKLLAEETSD